MIVEINNVYADSFHSSLSDGKRILTVGFERDMIQLLVTAKLEYRLAK
jgi:hypothetical protein